MLKNVYNIEYEKHIKSMIKNNIMYKNGIVFTSQRPVHGKNEQDTCTGNSCFNLFFFIVFMDKLL